ncbi:CotH kinase family protein [Chondromyces apiculatus]|uniref:Cellulosomal protein n=1 Tax=Chondromyces apiculatus DSM 436 TaxID=1192034 RepID=A0A017T8C9_9BACT|nr:CotH kinase family protein [Chondromyces apiculatus]EYF05494.1 Hypothetical protein CAP_3222 [Chondromyces apiculatus DSM 436]
MRSGFFYGAATVATLAAMSMVGCGETTPEDGSGEGGSTMTDTSAGGSGGSGGAGGSGSSTADEDPDYARAFPQDRVARLDITITPENWQAMVDDMTSLVGEFGQGMGGPGGPGGPDGPGGGGPPQELIDACDGLAVDEACTATLNGNPITGTCMETPDGALFCRPSGGPGGPGGSGGIDLIGGTPIYADCTVTDGTRTLEHVGIRFKGNNSLQTSWSQGVWKLPLRLNFDKFEDDHPETKNQKFYGFEDLSLSNGSSDQSLVREKVAMDVFREAGVPAPVTAFFRVFIDHGDGPEYFGLYTGMELPSDEAFLDTQLGGHKGNLYKPDGSGATWATYSETSLEKENNETEADYSDVLALFEALHADRTDAAAWRAGLEARLDVEGFLRYLAVNTVIEDWDQYGRMSHNYYMYADPDRDAQLRWITWDHSYAFPTSGGSGGGMGGMNALSLALDEVTDQWPLIRYLLDDAVYVEMYRGLLQETVEDAYEPGAAAARFEAAHTLIAPYVVGAEGEVEGHTFVQSETSFTQALPALIEHASSREQDVTTLLGP